MTMVNSGLKALTLLSYLNFHHLKLCVATATHNSLVRYVILAISVAKIDFIVFMASLGVQ